MRRTVIALAATALVLTAAAMANRQRGGPAKRDADPDLERQ